MSIKEKALNEIDDLLAVGKDMTCREITDNEFYEYMTKVNSCRELISNIPQNGLNTINTNDIFRSIDKDIKEIEDIEAKQSWWQLFKKEKDIHRPRKNIIWNANLKFDGIKFLLTGK
ncbi:MAG: hypothetical protein HOB05_01545 [Bacteroidetes bacterium]|jgi:hypothetical protein|nr:hypothetical protein [Bacteroidota bacterium]